jgi:predicted membrane chloride channel (bestrophin family)
MRSRYWSVERIWAKLLDSSRSLCRSAHLYLNWAKERIDEMDAALASLEIKAGQVKVESTAKANDLVADLKKRRDEFQALLKSRPKRARRRGRARRRISRSSGTATKPR